MTMSLVAASVKDSDVLAPLDVLSAFPAGLPAYYRSLLVHDDLLIRAGAMMALIDLRAVKPGDFAAILAMCNFGGIKVRAFDFFHDIHETEWAEKVSRVEAADEARLINQRMSAVLAFDEAGLVEVLAAQFLATGRIDNLWGAISSAEKCGGWRLAAQWAIRTLVLAPMEATGAQRLLEVLSGASQDDLITQVCRRLKALGLSPTLCAIHEAQLALRAGDAKTCLARLEKIPREGLPEGPKRLMAKIKADALDKKGEYRAAYSAYLALHKLEVSRSIDPRRFYEAIAKRAGLDIPDLPPLANDDCVFMLGFPRSGTTLLENALAAHPGIETFEEIPSMNGVFRRIEERLTSSSEGEKMDAAFFMQMRASYALEIERRKRKPGAAVFIDKMPMRSGDAKLLVRLFPERRSIFSIRDPRDVIVSCVKQSFKPNIAMANLYNIHDAVKIYDFVMSQWFDTYAMDDPRIHYVKYDSLVTDFDETILGILHFLGLDWDERVRSFAHKAEERGYRTPSYQKVRQGLSIGVQSSWRNYAFLFEAPEARPLRRWVEFFGYNSD